MSGASLNILQWLRVSFACDIASTEHHGPGTPSTIFMSLGTNCEFNNHQLTVPSALDSMTQQFRSGQLAFTYLLT